MAAKTVYAVIGSNCFTGSHIVDLLLEDPANFVLGLSRSPEKSDLFLPYKKKKPDNFKFFQLNLVKETEKLMMLLDEHKPAYVINVAALSEVGLSNFQPVEYFHINTHAVVALCNQLRSRAYLKRYVHISSAEIYGSCPSALLEDAPYHPSTPYAVSKAAADMYLVSLFKNFKFPMNLIRSTNVYGRHQQLYKIIPRAFIYLKQGKKIELHGGGMAVKTWVHIHDVAEGIKKTIEKGKPGEIYHFSDVHSWSIHDLVKKICEMTGRDFESCVIKVGERLGQDARYLLDYTKARRELAWEPQVSFEEGLKEVRDWVEENWERITPEPLTYIHQI